QISVKNHQLNIHYRYVRAYTSYTFEYRNGDMVLVHAKTFGRHAASGNTTTSTFNFIDKKIVVKKGNISSDSVTTKSIPIKYKGLKKLSEFGDMYDWKVAKYKYLSALC